MNRTTHFDPTPDNGSAFNHWLQSGKRDLPGGKPAVTSLSRRLARLEVSGHRSADSTRSGRARAHTVQEFARADRATWCKHPAGSMHTNQPEAEKGIEAAGSDPWRLVCPRGHTAWERRPDAEWPFYCNTCEQGFGELLDRKHERPRLDAPMGGEVA